MARSPPVLVLAGLCELWRTSGANCADALRTGGTSALDFRKALPARTAVLHVVARPRGPTAGHVHGLVDARHAWRHRRRCTVCTTFALADGGAGLGLQRLGPTPVGAGCFLGTQACRDRAGDSGRAPHGPAHAQSALAVVGGWFVLAGHAVGPALPAHLGGRRLHGLAYAKATRLASGSLCTRRPPGRSGFQRPSLAGRPQPGTGAHGVQP